MAKNLSQEEFIKRSNNLHNFKYDYSKTIYISRIAPVSIICPVHGEFSQPATSHLQGRGCLKCGNEKHGNNSRLTKEEFIKKSIDKHGDKYDYSKVDYISCDVMVLIICKKHNIEFKQRPINHYKDGAVCPECRKDLFAWNRYTKDKFIKKAIKIHQDRYDYSKIKYENNKIKIEIYCKKCGLYFWQTPHSHLRFYGCPHCHISVGETKIENWLKTNNIEYIYSHKFDDCRNETKHRLEFDFYLPTLNICIEFDGDHHKRQRKTEDGKNRYERIVHNDNIKTNYCLNQEIKLLRIPYSEINNLDTILHNTIYQLI